MKKTVTIKDIDCANCAAKIERDVQKINGVKSASLNFFGQRLQLECDEEDYERIAKEIVHCAKKVEPDCVILGL
ncbi:MAG: cation transporter [Eubacteriales bacterium]|nr:cation transporter [Eubacteriales bacterium]